MGSQTLTLDIEQFIGSVNDDASLAELAIVVDDTPLTELHDAVSRTTRTTVRVSTRDVAFWLCTRHWRMRYEPRPESPGPSWRRGHAMAAIGGGYAWPDIDVSGDGERVRIVARSEAQPDVAAVRYLQSFDAEIPRATFDTAVGRFLNRVESRLGDVGSPDFETLRTLRAELEEETSDPSLATRCRREASAGIDAGDAGETWHREVDQLARRAGDRAVEDMLVAARTPALIDEALRGMEGSSLQIDLPLTATEHDRTGLPWQRGVDLARQVRASIQAEGPIDDRRVSEIFGVALLPPDTPLHPGPVRGALRRDTGGAKVLGCGGRRTSQRFFLARILGLAHLDASERALPVADTTTALQKVGRAFAQEFLLPWAELDGLTDEEGIHSEVITRIAARYRVSEMLVTTTLVNRGKLGRDRLAAFFG